MAERRAATIAAAYVCFTRHGLRRTTMDDLAREAGMSRPALYQYFSNKEDVFRSLVTQLTSQALATAREAAAEDGDLPSRVTGILAAKLALVTRVWRDGPAHAAELLGPDAPARDLVEAYEGELCALLAGVLRTRMPDWDADEVAAILLAFTRGLEIGATGTTADPAHRLRRGTALFLAGLDATDPPEEDR